MVTYSDNKIKTILEFGRKFIIYKKDPGEEY